MEENSTRQGLLIVVSGPAAVGKDAVLKRLRRHMADLHFIVTATTRDRRRNEAEGRDYFFVSHERFQQMISNDELLEHATVHGKNQYGVPRRQVRAELAAGHDAIMRIDVQGAAKIRSVAPDTVFIFLYPGSLKELERRLRKRRSSDPDDLARRLANAPIEMARVSEFEYTVVNRDGHLKEAVENVAAIITAERCKTKPRVVSI